MGGTQDEPVGRLHPWPGGAWLTMLSAQHVIDVKVSMPVRIPQPLPVEEMCEEGRMSMCEPL